MQKKGSHNAWVSTWAADLGPQGLRSLKWPETMEKHALSEVEKYTQIEPNPEFYTL